MKKRVNRIYQGQYKKFKTVCNSKTQFLLYKIIFSLTYLKLLIINNDKYVKEAKQSLKTEKKKMMNRITKPVHGNTHIRHFKK